MTPLIGVTQNIFLVFTIDYFPFFGQRNLHSIQISQFDLKPCGRMLEEPPSLRCVLCEAVIFFRDGRWSSKVFCGSFIFLWVSEKYILNFFYFNLLAD